ncbi:MAG: hypothetical protein H0U10_17585 [Chloroflexia bacterium]|nr:hypothetical protein [Chloroflexia bacterium]
MPTLADGDIAGIAAVLERHAAVSPVERLERRQAAGQRQRWMPVVVETLDAGGHLAADPNGAAMGDRGGLRLRTFGWAAAFEVSPTGCLLTVDDETALGRRTIAEIASIVRRRQNVACGFLASDWGVPSLVLGLPIVASTVETASGRSGLAWAGVCLAAVLLGLWLYWLHARWLRRSVVRPPDAGVAATPPLRVALAAAAAALLALVGFE